MALRIPFFRAISRSIPVFQISLSAALSRYPTSSSIFFCSALTRSLRCLLATLSFPSRYFSATLSCLTLSWMTSQQSTSSSSSTPNWRISSIMRGFLFTPAMSTPILVQINCRSGCLRNGFKSRVTVVQVALSFTTWKHPFNFAF